MSIGLPIKDNEALENLVLCRGSVDASTYNRDEFRTLVMMSLDGLVPSSEEAVVVCKGVLELVAKANCQNVLSRLIFVMETCEKFGVQFLSLPWDADQLIEILDAIAEVRITELPPGIPLSHADLGATARAPAAPPASPAIRPASAPSLSASAPFLSPRPPSNMRPFVFEGVRFSSNGGAAYEALPTSPRHSTAVFFRINMQPPEGVEGEMVKLTM